MRMYFIVWAFPYFCTLSCSQEPIFICLTRVEGGQRKKKLLLYGLSLSMTPACSSMQTMMCLVFLFVCAFSLGLLQEFRLVCVPSVPALYRCHSSFGEMFGGRFGGARKLRGGVLVPRVLDAVCGVKTLSCVERRRSVATGTALPLPKYMVRVAVSSKWFDVSPTYLLGISHPGRQKQQQTPGRNMFSTGHEIARCHQSNPNSTQPHTLTTPQPAPPPSSSTPPLSDSFLLPSLHATNTFLLLAVVCFLRPDPPPVRRCRRYCRTGGRAARASAADGSRGAFAGPFRGCSTTACGLSSPLTGTGCTRCSASSLTARGSTSSRGPTTPSSRCVQQYRRVSFH